MAIIQSKIIRPEKKQKSVARFILKVVRVSGPKGGRVAGLTDKNFTAALRRSADYCNLLSHLKHTENCQPLRDNTINK